MNTIQKMKTDQSTKNWENKSMPNPGQESADNQAVRELRDSVKELHKSTTKYSKAIIRLTLVLALVAFIQLFVTLLVAPNPWVEKIIFTAFVVGFIIWGIKSFERDKDIRDLVD